MSDLLEQEIRTLRSLFWSERDPEGRAFAPLADAYLRAGETLEANDLIVDGCSRHPDFATGHVVAAKLYLQQGMLVEAGTSARRVLALDGENVVALAALAEVLEKSGETDEAEEVARRLAALDPDGAPTSSGMPMPPAETEAGTPVPQPEDSAGPSFEIAAAGDPDVGSAEEAIAFDLSGADSIRPVGEIDEDALGIEYASSGHAPEDATDGDDADFALDLDPWGAAPTDDVDDAGVGELSLAPWATDDELSGGDGPPDPLAADEEPLTLAAFAPDDGAAATPAPEEEEEDVDEGDAPLSLAAFAPDDQEEDDPFPLSTFAPDEAGDEGAVALSDFAPDDAEEEEAEGEPLSLAAFAPDDEGDEEPVSLAAFAPDEADDDEDEPVSLAAFAPDDEEEDEDEPVSLAAFAPDDEEGGPAPEPAPATKPGPVRTRTLAELYVKQGFVDKALDVLRYMQGEHPNAEDIRQRIAELEGRLQDADPDPFAPAEPARPVGGPSDLRPLTRPVEAMDDVETQARELAEGGLGEHDVDTPFAWTQAEERDAADDSGPTIGDYFDSLLAWGEEDPS